MKQEFPLVVLSLFLAACSLSPRSDVKPSTTVNPIGIASTDDNALKELRVQFEVVSPGGTKDMRLSGTEERNIYKTHQSILTHGNVVTTSQLALLDTPDQSTKHSGSLFGQSALVARITGIQPSPVVKFLSRCPSVNFETYTESFFEHGVSCGKDVFTYDLDKNGLKIHKNKRTVYKTALAPGLYRLEGAVLKVN